MVAEQSGAKEAFIIGGGQIYEKGLALSSKLYITEIDIDVDNADIFFPAINFDNWHLLQEEKHTKDEKNAYDFCFKVYERT